METFRTIFRSLVTLSPVLSLATTPAQAVPVFPFAPEGQVMQVASNCAAIGMQVAAENGGRLAQARPSTQGGRPVCVIVVLVPGKDGKRPRRAEFVVPQD
jgi:hypothetical protein